MPTSSASNAPRRRDRCPYCGTPGNGEPCDPSCPPRQTPQVPSRSPGEIAYVAYCRCKDGPYMAPADAPLTWSWLLLLGSERAAWEAAAQAVLAMQKEETHE